MKPERRTALTFTLDEIAERLQDAIGLAAAVTAVDALQRYALDRDERRTTHERLQGAVSFLEEVYRSWSGQVDPYEASEEAEVYLLELRGKDIADTLDARIRTLAAYAVVYGNAGNGYEGLVERFKEVGVSEESVVRLVREALIRAYGEKFALPEGTTFEAIDVDELMYGESVATVYDRVGLDELRSELEARGYAVRITFDEEES